jgi:hypothetical protein
METKLLRCKTAIALLPIPIKLKRDRQTPFPTVAELVVAIVIPWFAQYSFGQKA